MKYIFFDIDGTLRGQSRTITPMTKASISKLRQNGHKAFLCTGRAPISITPDITDIGFDGIISSAGGFIQIDGEYIYDSFINQYVLQEVLLIFTNAKVGYILETKDCLYVDGQAKDYLSRRDEKRNQENPELARMQEERSRYEKRLPMTEFDIGQDCVTKIIFITYDKIAFYDTVKYLSEFFNIVIFSKPEDDFINGEIIIKSTTKATAIQQVIEYYHGDMADTIAYGDSMNDYQMIDVVEKGIVYEKAPEKLLAISNDTFIDPDKEGITLSLQKLGLI